MSNIEALMTDVHPIALINTHDYTSRWLLSKGLHTTQDSVAMPIGDYTIVYVPCLLWGQQWSQKYSCFTEKYLSNSTKFSKRYF